MEFNWAIKLRDPMNKIICTNNHEKMTAAKGFERQTP